MNALAPEQKKIDDLNRMAWNKKNSDTMRSSLLSDEAIGLSRAINYRKGLAEGLRTYGYALFMHSQFSEAIEFLDQSMIIFLETGNESGQADISETRGIMARTTGEYQSAIKHFYAASQLRKKTEDQDGMAFALYQLGIICHLMGLPGKALEYFLTAFDSLSTHPHPAIVSDCHQQIGMIYLEMHRPEEAQDLFQRSLVIDEKSTDKKKTASCLTNIGRSCFMMKKYEEANEFFLKANEIVTDSTDNKEKGDILFYLAETAMAQAQPDLALEYIDRCYAFRKKSKDNKGEAEALLFLAGMKQDKQTLSLLKNALELSQSTGSVELSSKAHRQLYAYYRDQRIFEKAAEHLEHYNDCLQEIYTRKIKETTTGLLWVHEAELLQKIAELDFLQNVRIAGLTEENRMQQEAIAHAAEDLKSAQRQLLQREKMAFIGDLTTGIAQEMLQTLAIINNLSEQTADEVDSMNACLRSHNYTDVLKLTPELKNNLKKIHFHGKRAETTLKSMLRHTRKSGDKKEITDINKLVDDYLRISYQGMRLNDKSFTADLDIHFDPKSATIPVVPNEIGNVLMTILNNAFHSVNERRKISGTDYQPQVSVKTMKLEGHLKIIIRDNGLGIPETLKEKIFQPLFTGGGGILSGLSLCNETLKEHGGKLLLNDSSRGDHRINDSGAEFLIVLPV